MSLERNSLWALERTQFTCNDWGLPLISSNVFNTNMIKTNKHNNKEVKNNTTLTKLLSPGLPWLCLLFRQSHLGSVLDWAPNLHGKRSNNWITLKIPLVKTELGSQPSGLINAASTWNCLQQTLRIDAFISLVCSFTKPLFIDFSLFFIIVVTNP